MVIPPVCRDRVINRRDRQRHEKRILVSQVAQIFVSNLKGSAQRVSSATRSTGCSSLGHKQAGAGPSITTGMDVAAWATIQAWVSS